VRSVLAAAVVAGAAATGGLVAPPETTGHTPATPSPPADRAGHGPAGDRHQPSGGGHAHGVHGNGTGDHHGDAAGHVHAPVPEGYRRAHVPAAAWTSRAMLARGAAIHAERCAV
jgi:hypothetical protein